MENQKKKVFFIELERQDEDTRKRQKAINNYLKPYGLFINCLYRTSNGQYGFQINRTINEREYAIIRKALRQYCGVIGSERK